MKGVFAIARLEFARNWKLAGVPLSAVAAIVGLTMLGTRPAEPTTRGSILDILSVFVMPLAAVPAVVLGLNLFAPDIRHRRLSFFFTRPCAPWQLYFGRLLGAFLVTGVGWLGVVLAPSDISREGRLVWGLLLAGLLMGMNSLAMILAANASVWFVVDLVASLAFGTAVIWSLQETLRTGSLNLVGDFVFLVPAGVAALLASGLAYVSFGTANGRRGHRAHSTALWSCALLSVFALGARREFEWRRPLASVFPPGAARTLGPTQALVATFGRPGSMSFLLDTRTGEARRVTSFAHLGSAIDGTSARVARIEGRITPLRKPLIEDRLVISRLESPDESASDHGIPNDFGPLRDLSPDGRLALFSTSDGLCVMDVGTGVTRMRYAAPRLRQVAFQADGAIIALMEEPPSVVRMVVLTLDGKTTREIRIPVSTTVEWRARVHSDSGRVVVIEPKVGASVYEGNGVAVARFLPDPPQASSGKRIDGHLSFASVLFTRKGDLIVAGVNGLGVLRRGESQIRELPLIDAGMPLKLPYSPRAVGELESGDIEISALGPGFYSTLLADPVTGTVRLNLPGLRALHSVGLNFITSTSSPSEDTSLRLLQSEDGDIVVLDPGATKVRLLVRSTKEDR